MARSFGAVRWSFWPRTLSPEIAAAGSLLAVFR